MSHKMEKQYEQRLAVLAELLKLPENKECADCGARGPKWASWSLGIFLCINCAGIHRSLGTHISKVKSATLDKWTEEQLENMRNTGNGRAKFIYEATVPSGYARPREGSSAHALESWIRAKYDKKQFMERGRNGHKEKREEPAYRYRVSERISAPDSSPRERKPAPPSPEQQRLSAAPAKPLLIEPTAPKPAAARDDLLSGLFSSPSEQPQQVHQQQVHQQPSPGGDLFAAFGNATGEQPQQQKTVDKNSILSLYHQPIAPTMQMMHAGQQQRPGPNYNVHLMSNGYAPTGVPMAMVPPGMVPMAGYPAATPGWPAQGQQMMMMGQPHAMNPYGGFPHY